VQPNEVVTFGFQITLSFLNSSTFILNPTLKCVRRCSPNLEANEGSAESHHDNRLWISIYRPTSLVETEQSVKSNTEQLTGAERWGKAASAQQDCNLTPCNETNRRFGGRYCLHLQDGGVSHQVTDSLHTSCWFAPRPWRWRQWVPPKRR
jgi:hypothetical protein